MTIDYKETVFLPQTDFPMRAGLPEKEPQLLKQWKDNNLYQQLRKARAGKEKFILHDGPPYANGNIHIGHATNKILKDVVNRYQSVLGKDVVYVPGWDCHGLPIEWKIEEKYRAAKQDKDQIPILQFRQECRDFAAHWINVQREEFQRLGVIGDWDNPYITMTHDAESIIVGEIHKFVRNGALYQGVRSVMWSVVEKTALADAEIEYHDHKSPSIWVRFPIKQTARAELQDAGFVIWTTTPWTIPGNRAIAYGEEFDYAVITVGETAEKASVKTGDKLIVAKELLEAFCEAASIIDYHIAATFKGSDFAGAIASHPFHALDSYYTFDVPLLAGDFVTLDAGTGFVHIAPGHGEDDFNLGRAHKIDIPRTVAEDGIYYDEVALFQGKRVLSEDGKEGDANGAVIKTLIESGGFVAKKTITHSYPHSWRSKAPLIFRTTPQWFIAMDDKNKIRQKALDAISDSNWVPAIGENRIRAMIEQRPDWCISRQRVWGVPIALFVHKQTGEVLQDENVLQRIQDIFKKESADAWYVRPAEDFLGTAHNASDYNKIMDIVDIWFESGSSHAYVLEQFPDLHSPADLYLEGSDQHRGWFHLTLLESCGTRGKAPFKNVLTHGFVLDEQGRKMSKSMGNVTAPQAVIDQYGADILRLWVINSNYEEDVRVGKDIIKQQGDLYRRLRNTLRYLLGALSDFDHSEKIAYAEMPELEKWVLARLKQVDDEIRAHIADYDFHAVFKILYEFCDSDLSAFYFDIRKDALYCDRPDSTKRRAARTVMNQVFLCLSSWLAPILCFTAEEAWQVYTKGAQGSVHLQTFPDLPGEWNNAALLEKWQKIRTMRSAVTNELEQKRATKEIGSSLQAKVIITTDAPLPDADWAEICIVSEFEIKNNASPLIVAEKAMGNKCERCWQYLTEVGSNATHPDLCNRCTDAVQLWHLNTSPTGRG